MITPDTIENVSAPNLTGVWLFCKLNAYGYRKLVLARTEEAFKKSVLKCAWDIGSPADHVGMFGMAPCEITIVSFPKERVEQATKNIKRDQFDLLKSHVLFNARQHQKKLGKVPPGFTTGFKPKGVSSVLLYEKFYEYDKKEAPPKVWFVGTRKRFEEKFKLPEHQTPKPRVGFPSKAQQPAPGGLFAVAVDSWDKALDINESYDGNSVFCPTLTKSNILFWFQKKRERPDLTMDLANARAKELQIKNEQDEQKELARIQKREQEDKRDLEAFFGEE